MAFIRRPAFKTKRSLLLRKTQQKRMNELSVDRIKTPLQIKLSIVRPPGTNVLSKVAIAAGCRWIKLMLKHASASGLRAIPSALRMWQKVISILPICLWALVRQHSRAMLCGNERIAVQVLRLKLLRVPVGGSSWFFAKDYAKDERTRLLQC